MNTILIADDAKINRDILKVIFEDRYNVIEAVDGDETVKMLDKYGQNISLVFLDLIMPGRTGLEVLQYMHSKDMKQHIPVIMITGEATEESDYKAYEYGADDVVYKPFNTRVVTRRAMNLIEQYKYRISIENALEARTKEVIDNHRQMEEMNEFLLEALGSVVEFRSMESGEHIQRVKYFTRIILDYVKNCYPEYGLTNRQIELISRASALHDVGKIAIPDEILKAPRKLTEEEFETMKMHTVYGCEILDKFKIADNEFFKYCYHICRWHHEKVDGKGYPDGLKDDDIPIYCQVVSMADCFDALVSKRVYKDAVDCTEAYNMIMDGQCGAFSDKMRKCFEMSKLEMFMAVEKVNKLKAK